jgi:hypothetical protein
MKSLKKSKNKIEKKTALHFIWDNFYKFKSENKTDLKTWNESEFLNNLKMKKKINETISINFCSNLKITIFWNKKNP